MTSTCPFHVRQVAKVFLATAFICLALTTSAQAQPRGGAHVRSGTFVRLSLGGGWLNMKREGSVGFGAPDYYLGDSHIRGGAGIAEISVGGTISPGFVLSGTLLLNQIGDPVLEETDSRRVALDGPLTFAVLGATFDWFPQPHGGFHVGATVGLAGAWAKSPPPRFREYLGGSGGAIGLHLGYLWWVSREWSVGMLGRFVGARLHGEATEFGITGAEDDEVSSTSFALQATFH